MKSNLRVITYTIILYLVFCIGILALPMPNISAEGAILIEPKTNTILYSKNANEKFYPASTTKILTCLILIEEMPITQILTKSTDSIRNVPFDSSHIGLTVGDQYAYLDGLYAILMGSDNFVSYDMAEFNAGSQSAFVEKMNKKAESLGATSSHFVNPHGYHDPNHYTTPYDLAQIAIGAFNNPTLSKIAGTPKYNFSVINTGKTIPLEHTAALLDTTSTFYNPTVTAVKTGYHTPAGRTLVAKATYDDMELIGVILKADNPKQFSDMNALFNYGSENFKRLPMGESGFLIENISYSPWAKEAIDYALSNGWIARSTRNYMSTLTTNEFLTLLKSVLSPEDTPVLYAYDSSNPSATILANKSITRQDAAYILYTLCNQLPLKSYYLYDNVNIPDLAHLPDYYQEAILFTSRTNLLGTPNSAFNPSGLLTYEQAINIAYKLDKFFSVAIPFAFN